jgi:hypothetical protein
MNDSSLFDLNESTIQRAFNPEWFVSARQHFTISPDPYLLLSVVSYTDKEKLFTEL